MCGLVAGVLFGPEIDQERLCGALRTLAHRGPDDESTWISPDGHQILGHVRLGVMGGDQARQPFVGGRGEVQCAVNGELYGYRETRAALAAEGSRFTTDSDGEIALHLYEKWGTEFPRHLRGEFAVVILDRRDGSMVAVRDRFGIKPLYYAVHRGHVLVASEIKALLALGVPARWDLEGYRAECYNVRTAARSLFAGIASVPPGCLMIARDGRVGVHRYHELSFPSADLLRDDPRTPHQVVDGLRDVLTDSVAQRAVCDVETGALLSGGVDSASVLALLQAKRTRPVHAFTVAFDDASVDESTEAGAVAQAVGARWTPVRVTPESLAEAFPAAVWHAETLAYNANSAAKFLLSRAVRDAGLKVVLTGEGADEMLGGYRAFRSDMLLHPTHGMSRTALDTLLLEHGITDPRPHGLCAPESPPPAELAPLTDRLGRVPAAIDSFWRASDPLRALYRDGFRGPERDRAAVEELLTVADPHHRLAKLDPINQSIALWLSTQLPVVTLPLYGDRVEMAHSVEARLPFLDDAVADYCAGLPVWHKVHGLRQKDVLRRAMRGVLPPDVVDREKRPFLAPADVGRGPLDVLCQDVVRSRALDDQPFYDPAAVRAAMDRTTRMGPADRAAAEPVILRVVSTCLLQDQFGMGT